MEKLGKPVEDYSEIRKLVEKVTNKKSEPIVDFSDTATAFASLSDSELKKSAWLFGLMNKHCWWALVPHSGWQLFVCTFRL